MASPDSKSLDSKFTNNRRFSFEWGEPQVDTLEGEVAVDTFSVVEMTGFEALSKPFNFELILVSYKGDVDFKTMLSNPATLKIYAPDGTKGTAYHGEMSEFEQLQKVNDLFFYRAVLVPRLRRLDRYRTSDVFLNDKKTLDILDTVIKASDLTSSDYEK